MNTNVQKSGRGLPGESGALIFRFLWPLWGPATRPLHDCFVTGNWLVLLFSETLLADITVPLAKTTS